MFLLTTKMKTFLKKILLLNAIILIFSSCSKQFKDDNFTAYFGGEITNPTNSYVLFCKDSKVIDSILLNKDNTFFIKIDSLTPGLYSFKHEPEYQYVYFEKNDSLMISLDSKNFDESLVFSGRGEQKNNFLMDLYLKNQQDKSTLFSVLDLNVADFSRNINTSYQLKEKFYNSRKETIKWSDDFDIYAKGMLQFYQYSKKEMYPMVHKMRTGENIKDKLPKDFYDFRQDIDFNDNKFTDFSPFVKYLSAMLNNIACDKEFQNLSNIDKTLEINIKKLDIADTLFDNAKIKNKILDNIAFNYLLEDQNIENNKKFLDRFYQLSDKSNKNDIIKIGNSIQLLKPGNVLPKVDLVDLNNKKGTLDSFITKKTVLFFWTESLESHMIAAHKKIMILQKNHPEYQFIAVNVNQNQQQWTDFLANYKFKNILELRAVNFEDIRTKLVINKINRTLIINADKTINNAFDNIFAVEFESHLK